jgi:hypothetical protein
VRSGDVPRKGVQRLGDTFRLGQTGEVDALAHAEQFDADSLPAPS